MRLRVRLFAGLRERARADEIEVELGPEVAGQGAAGAATVLDLKRALERRAPELGPLDHVRVALDRAYASDSTPLGDVREVALIPPVSGGSGEADADLEQGVFELSHGPIDPAGCQRRVEHPACGGVVLFSGQARDHSRGRSVLGLEYEAYEAMLAPEMERIFARCRSQFGGAGDAAAPQSPDPGAGPRLRMLVVHRAGKVAIGEPAVVVAVASPHRDAAFRACRFLIDELKLSLPVWKRESYPGGETWIGDRP
jgi:molybdopterin synthase catalytic subunit/molybdopterin converting factor small subunit